MKRFFFIVCTVFILSQKTNGANYYWVGGSGDWNDLNHWATTSGGTILHGQIPTALDDVFFDANSFTGPAQTVTINVTEALCNNMDWTGVGNNPEFLGTALNTLKIYGSLTLAPVMKLDLFGPVRFEATSAGKTITSLGQVFHYSSIVFNGVGGSWILTDSLTLTAWGSITLNNGVLNTNNKKVTANSFISVTSTSRSLIMGSSIFNLMNGFTVSPAAMTVNAGTSTINLTDPNGCSFSGGGFTYYNLNMTGPGAIYDDNTFNDVFFASDGTIGGNNIFNDVFFSGNGTINGNNFYHDLQFSAGYSYTLAASKTQRISTTFSANGNCGGHITIVTDIPGSQSTINHPPGTVTADFAILKDISATGGATFTANNSIDLGNNTGWIINVQTTQDLFWVGNAGNWNDGNHWSTTSGGSPSGCCPTPSDNVFFDANSFTQAGQTVTINGAGFCKDISWSGALHNPNFAGGSSDYLKVYGSLTFITGMTLAIQGNVYFEATTMGKTITSAGKTFGSVIFNGIGGGWTLQDGLRAMMNVSLNNGTLNTNNQTVTADGFKSTSSTTRTLTMGSSVFNLSGGSCWQVSTSGIIKLTLNSGTSTINSTNLGGSSFSGDGLVYYDLNFSGPGNIGGDNTFNNVHFADNGIVYGNNIFNTATFLKNGIIHGTDTYNNLIFTAGFTYTLESGATQTINGSLTANGTCASRITIAANSPGIQTLISHPPGAVTVSFVNLKDIRAMGGATFTANNAVDLGNNSGWIINSVAPKDLYWIGNTGDWDDGNHWSLSSGGPPLGCLPSPVDNVFFDINSFTAPAQTVTINVEVAYCKSMTWTGAANNPALEGLPTYSLKIYGSLTLISGMTQHFQGAVFFEATTTGKTINSAGKSFLNTVTINGVGGGWTLQDSLTTTGIINFNNGTFTTNNKKVNAGTFASYSTTTRILNMGSSIFNLSNVGLFWDINPTGMTINAGTSVINNINSGNGGQASLRSSGFNYYNLNFNNVSGVPGSIIGNNNFHDVFFVTDGIIENNNTFHDAVFSGNGTIRGNNTYHDLTFTPNYVYTLSSGKTQTIQNKWNILGSCNWYILLQSSIAGSPSFVTKTSGTVNAYNMHIRDIHCSGGATFNAYNCVDLGGNSGWHFLTLDPLSNPGPITGPVSVCAGQTGVVYYLNSVTGALSYNWTVPPGAVITSGQGDTSIVVNFGATSGNVTVTAFNGCEYSNASSTLAVTVNPILTPGVTITASPGNIICAGSSATFTATASNTSGGTINYNFKINGVSVQSGASNTYTSASLVNGDAVTCVITITGGGSCLTTNTASSNTISITVMAYITPAVSITASPPGPICAGTAVTFTAAASNTGSGTVNYNFKINGSSVQNGSSNTYTSTALINGDAVTCDITVTGGNCLTVNTASSNTITMTVSASYTPAVSITASPPGPICAGASVTFTATASNINGGTVSYNFKINGASVQNGASNIYTSSSLVNGDAVTCDITVTGGICLTSNTASSNTISMTVNSSTPSVTIAVSPQTSVCAGTTVTFTATASNISGGTVNYNFKINGASVQSGASNIYTSSSFINGDAVSCDITVTGGTCLIVNTASSNTISMTVIAYSTPVVSITVAPQNSVCAGTSVTFTANANNTAGGTVNYNFKINGSSVQNGSSNTYTSSSLVNSDAVTCDITVTGGTCLTANTASSNTILMTVMSYTPGVSIVASPAGSVCANTTVTYTASASNTSGGTINYNFRINGVPVQSGASNIYISSSHADGDAVTCDITVTGGTCLTANTASSNTILKTVVIYTPTVSISVSPTGFICAGTTVSFTATASNTSNGAVTYNFKINGVTVQSGPSNIFSSSTLKNSNIITCDIVISGGNCLTSAQALSNAITMLVIRPARVNLGEDTKICPGDYLILKAPDYFARYVWNTGDTSTSITVTQPQKYWLRVLDQNGCISTDTISVAENHICGSFIPSAFTPNNDGLNDVFKPVITGNFISYKLSVFNRWGEKIFESNDPGKGWDGTLKTEKLKTDVFIWMCEYQLAGKPAVLKRGTVTLIR